MKTPTQDPRQTQAKLGRAYWNFYDLVAGEMRPLFLPWVDTGDMEAIEEFAAQATGAKISILHQDMLEKLRNLSSHNTDSNREEFKRIYDEAVGLTLPATCVFLQHTHAIDMITRSHSLSAVDLKTLKSIDRLAHKDSTFKTFVTQLVTKLASKVGQLDVIAYSQFFEIYGEAVTLQFLRSRTGLTTERVPEAREGRPDFRCELENGRVFHIEVKSLDVVGGEFRQREMMEDALGAKIDLEAQLNSGKGVAFTTTEIAPYKGVGATAGYDWRSLITVIDTLRNKCRQAFKSSQFTLGPPFALALLDRLIFPVARTRLRHIIMNPSTAGRA
jgi:hypothetical protein